MTPTYVALLRGVNVGGKNKLPMRDLAAMFEEAGCREVRTYIQSGNVIFEASSAAAGRTPERISAAIRERFGYNIPVVVRSAAEMAAVVVGNPFVERGCETKALHVGFLAESVGAERLATLDPNRSPPDEFHVRGREIFLYCPNGVARTKLSNVWFDSRLGTTSTMRNWNTVRKLAELSVLP